jgi:2-polyprenyl-6-methoxyphenol hydroxylase-like FAD-dependent oxidoreductase
MSGLLAALMLRWQGWETEIYERVAGELAGRGAGVVVQPSLIAHLHALGLDTGDLGVPVVRRQLLDRQGDVALTGHCPQILAAWECVYRMLRDAFPSAHYHRGRELASFAQHTASSPVSPTAAPPKARC